MSRIHSVGTGLVASLLFCVGTLILVTAIQQVCAGQDKPSTAPATPQKQDGDKPAPEDLSGTWEITLASAGAERGKITFKLRNPQWVIKNGEIAVKKEAAVARSAKTSDANTIIDALGYNSTFTLDTTKKPYAIDITPQEGPDKDKTREGIYVLEGDSLRILVAPTGAKRPEEFGNGGLRAQGDRWMIEMRRIVGKESDK